MNKTPLLLSLLSTLTTAQAVKTDHATYQRVAAVASAAVTPATLATSGQSVTAVIPNEYLYKRDVKVQAYDLDAFLKARVPNVEQLAAQGATVVFWCIDGYAPRAKLADLLGQGGLIAVGDADAPAGVVWPNTPYKDKTLSAPQISNYLVWRTESFPAKPQPWGLASIHVVLPSVLESGGPKGGR